MSDVAKISFDCLIRSLRQDTDFSVITYEYDKRSFGNFLIKVKYKNMLDIELLRDRSQLNILILIPHFLFRHRIPLDFIVEYFRSSQVLYGMYEYKNIDHPYFNYILSNKYYIDRVAKKKLQYKVCSAWKKCHRKQL